MGLDRVLAAIATLHDLPHLIAALGQEPLWEDLAPGNWLGGPEPALSFSRAATVGRAGGFRWLGVETMEPARAARRASRWLEARGQVAGIMALCPLSRQLALAVAPESAVLEIDLRSPGRRQLTALARLRGLPAGSPLFTAARIAEAFSSEGIGRRFFVQFRATLDRMGEDVPGPAGAEERRNLALLQLTRVLFLYFVQCKGWLDGREHFLRERVDDCLARNRQIHRDLLRPLFFGTLNRRPVERGRAAALGRIPFLNGGLFEPHPLERRWRGDIPNRPWVEAFDQLFERFHFTVAESGDEGAVAPDMLGRVFEGVMLPDRRKASGTFYTPSALVREVLDAALAALIANRLRCSDGLAARQLADRDPAALQVLHNVTLLDPAVGSGAFLLGALERLTSLRADGVADRHHSKQEILRRSLFGVDLNPMAVRLTELRLWLSVAAEDPAGHPEEVSPLPNLDCLIRQGDSLMDPVGQIAGLPVGTPAAGRLLVETRARLVLATGEDKREAARQLRRAEVGAMRHCLDRAEDRVEIEIAECLGEARSPTLFGGSRGLDSALRRRLRELRTRLRLVRQSRRRLVREGEVPWFQYEVQFSDVFALRGGFDLVVGNPPWVRAEQLPAGLRERLARRYRWWRSDGGPGYAHRPDLALAFVERGWELVSSGGVVALLTPAKISTAAYGTVARRVLSAGARLHAIADLTAERADCFNATVYPLALVFSKTVAEPHQMVRASLDPSVRAEMPQNRLLGGAPWVLVSSRVRRALEEVRQEHPRVGDRYTAQLGVKTGANAIFLNPSAPIEPGLIRWAVRGRDVAPFQIRRRTRLIWTHDPRGRVFSRLPPRAARYFDTHAAVLLARADYSGGVPWTLFRTAGAVAPHRVVWADLCRSLSAVPLSGEGDHLLVPLNTCYLIAVEDDCKARSIAAWLNSSWIRAVARSVADRAMGGFARFNAHVVSSLPLPETVLTDPDLPRLADLAAAGRPIQEELDELCARLLSLTPAARAALVELEGTDPRDRR